MTTSPEPGGSGAHWGPLFGARAVDWSETWEGRRGWGGPVYTHVLESSGLGQDSDVLDCGCGAGRFARLASDLGARVAGIDASAALIDIAARRVPGGDFRTGDLEALPWRDRSFDLVTGMSAFQFAQDKVRALTEARRVCRGQVAVVVPARVAESGIAAVFAPLGPLFPPGALESMRASGMFALSQPERLDEVLAATGLTRRQDDEVESPAGFDDAGAAVRAFTAAGPMAMAVAHSGEPAVAHAVRDALSGFTGPDGTIMLPAWYRVVLATP